MGSSTKRLERGGRLLVAVGLIISCAALDASSVRAGSVTYSLILEGYDNSSQMGALDVTLTNSSSTTLSVGGFSFGVMTSDSNVTFMDASTTTGLTRDANDPNLYIFLGNSFADTYYPPPSFDLTSPPSDLFPNITGTGAGSTLVATDTTATTDSAVTLVPGETVSLGRVYYSDPSGPSSLFCLITDPTATNLSDAYGNSLTDPNSPISGSGLGPYTQDLASLSDSPEPATVAMAMQALLAAGGFVAWSARARRRAQGVAKPR